MNKTKNYIYYAINSLPIAAINLTLFVYYPKYLVEFSPISITVAGIILAALKLIDLVLDPVIGVINEYLNNKGFSRVRIMNYSIFPLLVGLMALIYLTRFVSEPINFFFISFLFFIFWTIYNISYLALGLEICDDYKERNKLFGYRDGMILAGSILASALPVIYEKFGVEPILLILYLAGTYCLLLLFTTYLQKNVTTHAIKHSTLFNLKKLLACCYDKAFVVIALNLIFTSFGSTISGSLILIYIEYVLKAENANLFVFIFFLLSFISIPIWVFIAKFLSKKITLILSNIVSFISLFVVINLEAGDEMLYLAMICISALGIGGSLVMPSSMQADITYRISKNTSINSEAYLGSLWSMVKKLSSTLSVALSFWVLDIAGFVANQEQTTKATNSIIYLYAGVPLICYILGTLVVILYPKEEEFK